MLKIQVLGKGMIPRGYGLAPRIEPFSADFTLITTIMSTPGLNVNMIHPETGRVIPLTNQNVKRMYQTYANAKPNKNVVPQTSPAVPPQAKIPEPAKVVPPVTPPPVVQTQKPTAPVVNPPVQEKKPETPAPANVKDPAKTEEKPEVKDDKKETPVENKPADQQKSGATFKPINSDDRKNSK